jgi:hypothetical protein
LERSTERNRQPKAEPQRGPLSGTTIFEQVAPSVVRVEVWDSIGRRISQGSGFVVSEEGLIATNHHVIRGGSMARVVFANGSIARVIRVSRMDPEADLALLQAEPHNVPALRLASDGLPSPGTVVYAIGTPLGFTNTLSDGLISGHRQLDGKNTFLQTTAPISPGSSGGPLLTEDGKVVGVTTLTRTNGQNLNFAVPARRISQLLASAPQDLNLGAAGSAKGLDLWAPEEKSNIALFLRSMRRHRETLYLVSKDNVPTADWIEYGNNCAQALEDARRVNLGLLARLHPGLPDAFKNMYVKHLQLAVEYAQQANAIYASGTNNKRKPIRTWEDPHKEQLQSIRPIADQAAVAQRAWVSWWTDNSANIRYPDGVIIP